MSVVFDEEFFKELKKFFNNFLDAIRANWFWGLIAVAILFILLIIQQIILIFIVAFG